ncbi:nuclear pore complex subunit [Recurvomyces mirabilis]|uniref:Nuclear pore complex subunit n=1 Tax=Recurvomyces mirabilis TaxID=574656 RepID=A0AAE0WJQ0_9PEZI|nr:nuclear pore complex subunit [Recurvomyces mirabilis]KAK5150950.1 nuclear pore complex subunit [Recurvomyces mirabilis]
MGSLFDRIGAPNNSQAGGQAQGGGGLFSGGNTAATGSAPGGGGLFGGLGAAGGQAAAGGLFGNTTGTSNAGSGGLFSRPATTNAAPAGGLFGAAPAASSAGGGLFGNTTTTTSAGGALFGNTAAPSQPAGTGLFSGAAARPQNTTGPSLFGNSNAPASSTSLFGNVTMTAPQRPGQLFASTANSQAQQGGNASVFGNDILPAQQVAPIIERYDNPGAPAAQPSYFQALLDKGSKRVADENLGLPQLQYGLQDIARKVRNVGQGGPSAGQAARDSRSPYVLAASGVNVGQSLRDIEELMDTTTSVTRPSISHSQDYSQLSGVKDFLGDYHRRSFQKMIDTRLEAAQQDFDKMVDEALHMQPIDWQRYRNRIDVHFGLRKPDETSDDIPAGSVADTGSFGRSSRRSKFQGSTFGLASASRSVIGAPGSNGMRQSTFNDVAEKLPADGFRPAPEDRTQRLKQDKYSGKVKDLNVARIQEKAYPILTRFAEVEEDPTNEDTSMLVSAYKALVSITGEDTSKDSLADPAVPKERQFARDYLEDNSRTKGSIAMRERILNGSRSYLERSFYSALKTTVAKNPREANIGGVPTSVAEVKGYVRVRAARKELGAEVEKLQDINGDYGWAVIFYLLRSGLYEESVQYLEENAAAFKQIDRKFNNYLRTFVKSSERRLPPEMQTAVNNEYSQRTRLAPEDSLDPYRMVCYKIIGRCDLTRRNLDTINNDMMDWLWLQFALAREFQRSEEMAHESFGLEDLRQSIKEIGERYFGAGSDIANAPTTLFFMQILAGAFEKAVADLYAHSYVSATHFAIALDFYGLLRVSSDLTNDDLLTYTTREQAQIAFGSLIGLYTRDFRTADATAAVDYLTLICLNADLTGEIGKSQKELCYQAIIEVILETREFAQLLGDIRSDGQRIKGAVEQRLRLIKLDKERDFLKQITLVAARTAEEQSRTTDAALLFHLAEDYDKVIEIVNDAVSVYLTTELGEQPAHLTPLKPRAPQQQQQDPRLSSLSLTAIDDPLELALSMRNLYMSNDVYVTKIKAENLEITSRLATLASARKLLEQGKWAECIDQISTSSLLPTTASGHLSSIRTQAQSFNELPPVLARTIGHVMLWTVVACSNNIDRLRQAEFETGFQREAMGRCTQMAKDTVVFAGLIRYRLPGRVWEMLANAGREMGAY